MTSESTNHPQGDLRLLDTPIATELLASQIPARVAFTAKDGTPRIISTWFQWTGEELVMPTFVWAPHVPRPAARIAALEARPNVAISIDTEGFPPHVLQVRGKVSITLVDGLAPEYRDAARRYLGEEAAEEYLTSIDVPGTRMARIAVRPDWVGLLDFETRLPGAMAV
jgi:hypothetical protein